MDFRLLTYNFQVLTKPLDRTKVHFFILGLPKPIDILCGHEHKLRSRNIAWLNGIWPRAEFNVVPAHDGVHARRNKCVPVGKGGVFLAFGSKLKSYVTNKGITTSGRAIWAHLDYPRLGKIEVAVVYAPNDHL